MAKKKKKKPSWLFGEAFDHYRTEGWKRKKVKSWAEVADGIDNAGGRVIAGAGRGAKNAAAGLFDGGKRAVKKGSDAWGSLQDRGFLNRDTQKEGELARQAQREKRERSRAKKEKRDQDNQNRWARVDDEPSGSD